MLPAKLPFSFHDQVLQQDELKETTERSDGGERLRTASQCGAGDTAGKMGGLTGNLELLS